VPRHWSGCRSDVKIYDSSALPSSRLSRTTRCRQGTRGVDEPAGAIRGPIHSTHVVHDRAGRAPLLHRRRQQERDCPGARISRFKVARLLDARAGMGSFGSRSERRRKSTSSFRASLRRGTAAGRARSPPDRWTRRFRRAQLGRACAELLTQTLEADDVLGIRGVGPPFMVAHLTRLPGCTVVQ